MPSPFPGMDPSLEDPAFWPDFHHGFITYCRDVLAERLPDRYEARIDEQVNLVELSEEDAKLIKPDLAVTDRAGRGPRRSDDGSTATLEPVATIPLPVYAEVPEARIQLLRRPERTLVTVLELLSPSKKAGDSRDHYLAKRNALIHQRVHLMELDLLVGGRRPPLRKPLPPGDYYALVSRSDRRPDCDVYAWTVRDRLPEIPVPLSPPDPDFRLDLAEVFTTTYERGRYLRSLNYAAPPVASLTDEHRKWALAIAASSTR